jgi:hypothetical protein
VCFDYTSDAMTEIGALFRKSGRVIIPLTVQEAGVNAQCLLSILQDKKRPPPKDEEGGLRRQGGDSLALICSEHANSRLT